MLVVVSLDLQQAILLILPTLSIISPLIPLLVRLLVKRVADVQLSYLIPHIAFNQPLSTSVSRLLIYLEKDLIQTHF